MSSIADRLGRPLRDLRISLTDRCNLRCGYCMPAHIFGPDFAFLPASRVLGFPEIVRLASVFGHLGARKIRLTGGEPLMRPGVENLVRELKETGLFEEVALTTNGWFLAEKAAALREAGLDRINVSLDALSAEVSGQMNGRGWGAAAVLEGIEAARAVGLPVKINMVVQRGVNEGEIVPLASYCRERGLTLRFIEFMDVGNHNGWSLERVVPSGEILDTLAREWELEPVMPGYRGEVARRYRYADTEVEVGFISSVTAPFCRDCTRARLSADGRFFTCLFATSGLDLASALRSGVPDQEVEALVRRAWLGRSDHYSEERGEATGEPRERKVEMSFIGG
jgi:GTP 3',8-cyclase